MPQPHIFSLSEDARQRGGWRGSNYQGGRSSGGGASGGQPTRADVIRDKYEQDRLRTLEEKEMEADYVNRYGARYLDFVQGMDPTDKDFDKTVRSFDYRAKKIPGFNDALENKKAERREYEANLLAQDKIKQDEIKEQEARDKELDDFGEDLVKQHLSPREHGSYLKAKQAGNEKKQNELLEKAFLADEAADKADADSKSDMADDKGRAATITGLKQDRTNIQSSLDELEAKKKALDDFNKLNSAGQEAYLETKKVPRFDEQDLYSRLQKDLINVNQSIKSHDIVTGRKDFKKAGQADAPLNRIDPNASDDPLSPDNTYKAELEQIEELKSEIANSDKGIPENEALVKEIESTLSTLTDEKNKLLESVDPNNIDIEVRDKIIALDNEIDEFTAHRDEFTSSLESDKAKSIQNKSALDTLKTSTQTIRTEKYNSLLDSDTGKFIDDKDESDFLRVYDLYAKDKKLDRNHNSPDHYYDYRRAYAEGDLTIDTQGHLPSKWKKEGHPRLYQHPKDKKKFSKDPKSGWIDTRDGSIVKNTATKEEATKADGSPAINQLSAQEARNRL